MEMDIDAKKEKKQIEFPKLDNFISYSRIMMEGLWSPENWHQWLQMYKATFDEYNRLDEKYEMEMYRAGFRRAFLGGAVAGAILMLLFVLLMIATY